MLDLPWEIRSQPLDREATSAAYNSSGSLFPSPPSLPAPVALRALPFVHLSFCFAVPPPSPSRKQIAERLASGHYCPLLPSRSLSQESEMEKGGGEG